MSNLKAINEFVSIDLDVSKEIDNIKYYQLVCTKSFTICFVQPYSISIDQKGGWVSDLNPYSNNFWVRSDSKVYSSCLSNCIVLDSTVSLSGISNCDIRSSWIDLSSIKDSYIFNSNILDSRISHSTVEESNIKHSSIDFCTLSNIKVDNKLDTRMVVERLIMNGSHSKTLIINSNNDYLILGPFGTSNRIIIAFKNQKTIHVGCSFYTLNQFFRALQNTSSYHNCSDYYIAYRAIEMFFANETKPALSLRYLFKNILHTLWKRT